MGRVAQGAEKLAQNGTVTTGLLSMLLRALWVKAKGGHKIVNSLTVTFNS